jgi:D-glycero-alpha-D-manno-heptose 1-phosphate guanylyltransferase
MEKTDTIILAGGEGKRLRSLVKDVPKPLAMVDGKPFLDILLAQLNECNCVNQLVLAVGYRAAAIIERYGNCSAYKFDIVFSIEEELLGTGGAIKKALVCTKTEDVLVMNGDSYAEVDIAGLIKAHRSNHAALTVVLTKVADTSRYGSVRVDTDNRIVAFEEKRHTGKPGLINAGIYMLKRDIFNTVEQNKIISMEKELLPAFMRNFKNEICGYITNGKFIDIGVPETYKIAANYLGNRGIE